MNQQPRTSLHLVMIVAVFLPSFIATTGSAAVVSLDGEWLLATDPENREIEQMWWNAPLSVARKTKVPWIIQDAFPGYHGVAWYWKEFDGPANLGASDRALLRFWQVDYKADVWLNDTAVGSHEGGESSFVLE